jgi:hypothetical protein
MEELLRFLTAIALRGDGNLEVTLLFVSRKTI